MSGPPPRDADFQQIVDTSPAMLWTTDADGLCTYLSRQWYEFTGRTPEQDLGTGWLENVHPDDRARTSELFRAAHGRAEPSRFDYRLRRRDGVYRWAMDACFPRFGADGQFLGFVGSVIDIHDRVALEDRFRSVARAVGLGVWYCDLPFSELIWDATVKEHFHLPPDARVTIETFYERIHPDDRERTRQAIDDSIANHGPYDIHYRTTNAEKPAEIAHVRAIGWTDYDEAGTPIRFDGVTLDVTDEVEAQRELQDTRVRYERATRATKNAIWDWDLVTQAIQWNEALHSEYGHSREALQSTVTWWGENVHDDDRDRVVHGIHAVIESASEQFWSAEYRFRRGDGTFATVFDRGFIVRDAAGRPLRMIGAMEDITSRKEAEEALRRAIRARDEFLSIASHELKTPLTSLKLQAELLTRSLQKGDVIRAQRIVDQTLKQVDRLGRLVDDMLDVSRISTGKLALQREELALAPLATDVVEAFRAQFDRVGAHLELHVDETVRAWIDRARIEQVLVNFLGNALKYGRDKPVTVRVEQREGSACVAVVDHGIGIAREHHERIFDRFERAVEASGITGLGLGLFISKQIVEMHGGRIDVTSEPGVGSSFTMVLPTARAR